MQLAVSLIGQPQPTNLRVNRSDHVLLLSTALECQRRKPTDNIESNQLFNQAM